MPEDLIRNLPWHAIQTLPPQSLAHTGATGYWVVRDSKGNTVATIEPGAAASFGGGTKTARVAAMLLAEAPAMLHVLERFLRVFPDACRLDHHGLCQAHNCGTDADGEPACEVKDAVDLIKRLEKGGLL